MMVVVSASNAHQRESRVFLNIIINPYYMIIFIKDVIRIMALSVSEIAGKCKEFVKIRPGVG